MHDFSPLAGRCRNGTAFCVRMNKINPRWQNGNLRRKNRARFKAMNAECGICHGRYGAIHYDEPSSPQYPLSFVIDEIKPMSRWREFGYESAREACEDWENLQAAHYCCNAWKSNKLTPQMGEVVPRISESDGKW